MKLAFNKQLDFAGLLSDTPLCRGAAPGVTGRLLSWAPLENEAAPEALTSAGPEGRTPFPKGPPVRNGSAPAPARVRHSLSNGCSPFRLLLPGQGYQTGVCDRPL